MSSRSSAHLRADVGPTVRLAAGHLRVYGRNLLATFDNNRAESLPALGWIAWATAMQFLHSTVDEPEGFALTTFGVPIAVCALALFKVIEAKAKGTTVTLTLGALALLIWSALTVAFGITGQLAVMWVLILGVMYVPFLKMILDVKHTPPTVLQLPPQEKPADPVDEFEGVSWLRGGRWAGPERPTATGSVRRLELPPGAAARQFAEARVGGIANLLGVDPSAVKIRDVGNGRAVDVYRHDRVDLHAEPRAWPWANRQETDVREPVPLGVTRAGDVVPLPLGRGHILIGGATGAGKSVALGMVTTAVALDPGADLYAIDPKIADLRPFQHACRQYAQDDYAEGVAVLEYVAASIPQRMRLTDEHRVSSVQEIPPLPDGSRAVPAVFLVVDELAHFTVDAPQQMRERANRALGVILKQGRAADVWLVAATQRPSKDTVPTDMRAQFRFALCLRVREQVTTKMVLGDAAGVDASAIPSSRPGVGYLQDDDGVELVRSFFLPPDELHRLAALAPDAVGRVTRTSEPLATVHELRSEEQGGGLRFPDHKPVPPAWETDLWVALGDGDWLSLAELCDITGKTRKTVTDTLRDWTERRYLQETKRGKAGVWKRAA